MAGKDSMTSISVFILLGLHWVHSQATDDRIECYLDENMAKDNPNNIYRCSKTEKCCKEGGLPSCCSEKPTSVAAWEQAKLWGTLAAMIIVLALLMWYCRHDGNCCGNKKGQRRKGCCCCCGSSSRNPDDSDIEITTGPEGKQPLEYADLKEERE